MSKLALVLCVALCGCASSRATSGPALDDVVAAIRQAPPEVSGRTDLPPIAKLKGCRPFDNEPTHYLCQLRLQGTSGQWSTVSVTLTRDAGRWVLLQLE